MKLVIDIPKEVVVAIENGFDYIYDIHAAIAQGIPYEDRPQGDWLEDDGIIACSECGTRAVWITNNDYGSKPYISNFCPKCGADMKVKKNGKDRSNLSIS